MFNILEENQNVFFRKMGFISALVNILQIVIFLQNFNGQKLETADGALDIRSNNSVTALPLIKETLKSLLKETKRDHLSKQKETIKRPFI